MEVLERSAAISGLRQSEVGRRLDRDPLALTVDACLAAIEDAGLRREDIDGLSTYPGGMAGGGGGFAGPGIPEVHDALRLELAWWSGGPELPGRLGAVVNACMAVATGLATHVLCYRTVWESTAQGADHRSRSTGSATGRGAKRCTGVHVGPSRRAASRSAVPDRPCSLWDVVLSRGYGTSRVNSSPGLCTQQGTRRMPCSNPKAIIRDPVIAESDGYMARVAWSLEGPTSVTIDLWATSNVFHATGHRIRVEVSSSNFPRFESEPEHQGAVCARGPKASRRNRRSSIRKTCPPISVLPILGPDKATSLTAYHGADRVGFRHMLWRSAPMAVQLTKDVDRSRRSSRRIQLHRALAFYRDTLGFERRG